MMISTEVDALVALATIRTSLPLPLIPVWALEDLFVAEGADHLRDEPTGKSGIT